MQGNGKPILDALAARGRAPTPLPPFVRVYVDASKVNPTNPNGIVVETNMPDSPAARFAVIEMLTEGIQQMAAIMRNQAQQPVSQNIVLVDGRPAPLPQQNSPSEGG